MITAGERLIDALERTTHALVEALEADSCAISRVLGDVLLLVTECVPPGRTLQLGQGYLVSEYPETQRVLRGREPRSVCLGQLGVDPAEERVLVEQGFASLLMLPLELRGAVWGLVEVYREEPVPFGAAEIRTAAVLLGEYT